MEETRKLVRAKPEVDAKAIEQKEQGKIWVQKNEH